MKRATNLDCIFRPKSVAVIGASSRQGSLGWEILHNLVTSGYRGKVFPVNPKADYVHSIKSYKSVLDIEDSVEMAVIVIPRDSVLKTVRDCGKKGVKGVVVITAGFKEVGGDGVALEEKLMRILKKYGMRMVGPNCMGVLNTDEDVRLNASFASTKPERGKIGFLSQSGALGEAILSHAKNIGIGLSKFVSMGNKPDISGGDLLEYWEHDDNVSLILMYLESFGNPQKFTPLARRISREKPIIAVKAGRTLAGARATISHTGALAGVDVATSALLSQCGVIRVTSIEEMFDVSKAFLTQPVPKSGRVAILSNAGGPAIMATDACAQLGLDVIELSAATQRKLQKVLPSEASVVNPVDILATGGPERYKAAMEILLADEQISSVLVVFVPPVNIDAPAVAGEIARLCAGTDKTVLSVFMAKTEHESGVEILKESGIPVYLFPESAAKALSALVRRGKYLNRPIGKVKKIRVDIPPLRRIIKRAMREGRELLTALEAYEILRAYGILYPKVVCVKEVSEAIKAANKMRYPVALKIDSIDVSHKTDIGGVVLNLQTEGELGRAFEEIKQKMERMGISSAECGLLIQKMVSGGVETIVGLQKKKRFGDLVMFGLGGIHVEVLKDVAFGVAPITDVDAGEMIRSIKGYPLLKGARGGIVANEEGIIDVLRRVSQIAGDLPEIIEMDINPLLVSPEPKKPLALDVRIRLDVK